MKVSTKGRYALRAMLDLATHENGEYISLKAISQRQGITVKYLEQIIPLLSRAGYVRSSRGSSGGYRLAHAPDAYTVGDILRAVEGSLAPVACLEQEESPCPRSDTCKTIGFWRGLHRTITAYVDSVTLQDLMEEGTDAAADYCI